MKDTSTSRASLLSATDTSFVLGERHQSVSGRRSSINAGDFIQVEKRMPSVLYDSIDFELQQLRDRDSIGHEVLASRQQMGRRSSVSGGGRDGAKGRAGPVPNEEEEEDKSKGSSQKQLYITEAEKREREDELRVESPPIYDSYNDNVEVGGMEDFYAQAGDDEAAMAVGPVDEAPYYNGQDDGVEANDDEENGPLRPSDVSSRRVSFGAALGENVDEDSHELDDVQNSRRSSVGDVPLVTPGSTKVRRGSGVSTGGSTDGDRSYMTISTPGTNDFPRGRVVPDETFVDEGK